MTFAPAPLLALQAWWVANGGVPLGIVGDASHAATGGYHEGRDDLQRAGVLANDYSVKQPRDIAGLSNAASAIDFGQLNGSLAELQRFSVWLVGQCQKRAPGWDDVREIIYSPDGVHVWRWSGVDYQLREGYPNGSGQGDASHLWHTHVSFYRDAEARDKLALVAGFFAVAPPPPPIVPVTLEELPSWTVEIKAGSRIRSTPEVTTGNVLINGISAPMTFTLGRRVRGGADPQTGRDDWYQDDSVGFTAAGNAAGPAVPPPVVAPPEPAPEPTPEPEPPDFQRELAAERARIIANRADPEATDAQ